MLIFNSDSQCGIMSITRTPNLDLIEVFRPEANQHNQLDIERPPTKTRNGADVVLILGQRRRKWTSNKSTSRVSWGNASGQNIIYRTITMTESVCVQIDKSAEAVDSHLHCCMGIDKHKTKHISIPYFSFRQ